MLIGKYNEPYPLLMKNDRQSFKKKKTILARLFFKKNK